MLILMKKNIITIAGRPGSGKSTTAKAVAAALGYRHYSSGDFFREVARELNIELLQANITAEKNTEFDQLVDKKLQDLGKQEDDLVIDSRMAWHWMPFSFKVFLNLDIDVAARRVLKNIDARSTVNENIPKDPAEYAQILHERLESETRRYKALYDVDPYNLDNYDLVIDTESNNIEQATLKVLENFKVWQGQ
jgi:cytidylate kinase